MVGSQNMQEHQQSAIWTICKLKNDKDLCSIWFANFSWLWVIKKNIEADKQIHMPFDMFSFLSCLQ